MFECDTSTLWRRNVIHLHYGAGMGAKDIVSCIPEVPITVMRPPPDADKLVDALYDAGQPRANRAPTVEKPEGTEDR